MSNKAKKIDEQVLTKLAQMQLPYRSIATILGVSESTIVQKYRDFIDQHREKSAAALTGLIWEEALEARKEYAVKMLAQRYLGFTDKVQHTINYEPLNKLSYDELKELAESALKEIKRIDEPENSKNQIE